MVSSALVASIRVRAHSKSGSELEAFVSKQGWTFDSGKNVISIPPNPDNQIESTVVQENIKLPRMSNHYLNAVLVTHVYIHYTPELVKVVSHAA